MKQFPDAAMPFRTWLDANVVHKDVRRLLIAVVRLASYSNDPEGMGAASALRQLKVVLRGVIYIDEGWQKIVDSLHSAAVSSGVNFVTSSRVVAVEHDGARVHSVALGGIDVDEDSEETAGHAPRPIVAEAGTRLPPARVVLAVDPLSVRAMLGDAAWLPEALDPVFLTCLDVALSRMPQPKATLAVSIDEPLYFSVHSQWCQLTRKARALIHVARYGG